MAPENAHAAQLRRGGETLAAALPPLVVEAERIAATVALGVHGRRRAGMGETFWEYRHYEREDGAARIDWRRSARSDDLFVRENEWEAAQSVWLWRDGRPGMAVGGGRKLPTKRDRAAVLTIALATLLSRGGERIAVLGESQAPRAGRVGLSRVALRLGAGPGGVEAISAAAIAPRGRLILASDFYEPLEIWRDRLAPLISQGVRGALVHVVAPSEEDFPFSGRARFESPGAGEAHVIDHAQSVRPAYRRRFAAHRDSLRDLARRAGWTYVYHRTDSPPAEALLALYAALAPERR